MRREASVIKKPKSNKKALLIMLYSVYLSLILISLVPFMAENDFSRGTLSDGEYESHLVFPANGTYGHYRNVILFDSNSSGKIDLTHTFDDNTLYIESLVNIKELVIDCRMMYENKCEEVLELDPSTLESGYYKNYFIETNNGLFTVIINTETLMETLQFLEIPIPKSVLVNNQEWWENQTTYYSLNENNITITNIPTGSTTVKIYFQEKGPGSAPEAFFTASRHFALQDQEITFNASRSNDKDGDILDYLWDFDDGSERSGEIVTHSYSELGDYLVKLTIRDNDDLEDTYLRSISIVLSDTDSDNDFVPDLADPKPYTKTDTDGDGLSDEFENITSRTDKNRKDTDEDGWDDKAEWDNNTNPNNPDDHPSDEDKVDRKGDTAGLLILIPILIVILIIVIFVIIMKKRQSREIPVDEELEGEEETEKAEGEEITGDEAASDKKSRKRPTAKSIKELEEELKGRELEQQKKEKLTRESAYKKMVIYTFECPDCGSKIPADAIVCLTCGTEFEEEEEGEEEDEGEVFECPDCGNNVAEEDTACSVCGAEFEDEEFEENNK